MKVIANLDLIELNIPNSTPILLEFDRNLKLVNREYLAPQEIVEMREKAMIEKNKFKIKLLY